MEKSKSETQKEYNKRTGYAAQKKYDSQNTVFIGIKLNKKTDGDIINAIEGKSRQTEIKRLVRLGLKNSGEQE